MRTTGLTNGELAVLGLVAERDMHGYEIERLIEERGMREWTEIGFSSIYHTLGILARQRLIEGRLAPAQGRGAPRKVYRVTAAGRKAYRKGVKDALSRPRRLFPFIQQGLAGLPTQDPLDAAASLDAYAGSLRERLARVREKGAAKNPFHVQCMFDYSERMVQAEVITVEELAKRIRSSAVTRRK